MSEGTIFKFRAIACLLFGRSRYERGAKEDTICGYPFLIINIKCLVGIRESCKENHWTELKDHKKCTFQISEYSFDGFPINISRGLGTSVIESIDKQYPA